MAYTLTWPIAMVMAAADVNPLITGNDMKSTSQPAVKENNTKSMINGANLKLATSVCQMSETK